jgi:hypothetical protein
VTRSVPGRNKKSHARQAPVVPYRWCPVRRGSLVVWAFGIPYSEPTCQHYVLGSSSPPLISRSRAVHERARRENAGRGREMAESMKHLVQVEPAKEAAGGAPSAGPTYRCSAGDTGASPPAVPGLDCCWDIFRYVVPSLPRVILRCDGVINRSFPCFLFSLFLCVWM